MNSSSSSSRVVLQILERYRTDKEYELHKSLDRHNQFHTLRYGFKPASVNSDEPAALELTSKGEVTIKAPNIDGSSSNYTVFRGHRRPHVKECLLVIDNVTGEMVLQKLTDNITVKATRTLGNGGPPSSGPISSSVAPNSNGNANVPMSNGTTTITASSSSSSTLPNNTSSSSGNNSSNFNHRNDNNNPNTTSSNSKTTTGTNKSSKTNNDGPQLSEESSSSSDDSDDDSSDSSSSSGSSSSDSESSSPSNDEGFTF